MTTYNFTSKEKQAIASVTLAMTTIDEKLAKEEVIISLGTFAKLGVTPDDIEKGKAMDTVEVISTIKAMTLIEKKLVSAILTSVMLVDNKIEDSEVKLITLLSIQTGIPVLSAKEAVDILAAL